jgi:hypothetical protein
MPPSFAPTNCPTPPTSSSTKPTLPGYSDGSPPLLCPRELEKNHSSIGEFWEILWLIHVFWVWAFSRNFGRKNHVLRKMVLVLVFFYILMDFGRFFFYRQLWKKLGFWSVYKNPKTKKPKEIKAWKTQIHPPCSPPTQLGDGLRGWLDVGGIGLGVGAGLIRPAGWGQWERPAGRLLGAGQPIGSGFS